MINAAADTGVIFDIKEFALHDGPGVRTTVFFKGCPLRCVWCHNPEGLSTKPQLMTKETRCLHCGSCRVSCSHEECRPFGRCIYACPEALISVCGREITADDLFARLMKDAGFLTESEGGITFSGGEPLLQQEFLCEMLDRLKKAGVHTAIETCGHAQPEIFQKAAGKADLVIMDLKIADDALHRKYTGVGNGWILVNAAWLKASGKAHIFRTPLIPGITDTEENLAAIKAIAGDSEHELLPYNELAGAKYPMLGETFPYESIERSKN